MSRVVAVILAGGRGERLGGVIKANLVVGGSRLLDRVATSLAGADSVLVSSGHIDPAALALHSSQIAVPDLESDYGGPLAGLAAAVEWSSRQPEPPEILVLAPVDTPFLPADYLDRLVAGIGTGAAAVASFEAQSYPTSSAWRLAAIGSLPAEVRAGIAPHSLKRLGESLDAAAVPFPPHAGGDPFANANTPAELLALQRRASVP